MKKIIYTALLTLATQQLLSQSNLVFFTEEGENFTLYVSGSQINDTPQSRVTATGITSDFAQIKVKFDVEGAPELKQNMMIDANMVITAIIKKNKKGRYVFRGVSSVPVENNTQTIRVAEIRETTSSTPSQTSSSTVQTTTSTNSNSASIGVNVSANNTGLNLNVNVNDQFTETEAQPIETHQSGSPTSQPAQTSEPDCTKMSSDGFNRASSSIKNKSFSDEKMTVFKQIARSHCMSVSQIKRFMELFTYEEGKLGVAKLAYTNCTNRENYYELNDALTYSESVEALNEFLENQ
ncbi:MAG: DUF4476 domain-containing protein [Bacteroidota bacterium]